jgi:hypothetical protein
MDSVAGLRELSEKQEAVCSRAQLRLLGVDADDVDDQVAARRWAEIGPTVVAMHRGPLLERARRFAIVLHCGPGSAVCAWTALQVNGLRGWPREAVHVVVRRGLAPPSLPPEMGAAVVHESRRHSEADVIHRDHLPTHGVERAAVDAGAWSRTDRGACGVLAAVVQQGLTTVDRLVGVLETVGHVNRRRLMVRAVQDIGGGSQALSEIDFVRFCRRRGLPEPCRQAVRVDSRGRRRYLDIEWRLPDGRALWVEIDGVGHMEVSQWYDDLLRAAEIHAAGTSGGPVRLPAVACRAEPDRVDALLRVLLGVVSLTSPYTAT